MLQNKLHLTKRPTTPNTIFNNGKGGISSYDMPPLPFQYATTYSRLNVRKAQPCLTTEHYNMHITQRPLCQRFAKGGKPHCKRPCFTVQKAAFYRVICRKLGSSAYLLDKVKARNPVYTAYTILRPLYFLDSASERGMTITDSLD